MSVARLRLTSQPLEQDVMVLTLRCLGREQFVRRDGKLVSTGVYVAADGSMFWRANAGAQVIQGKAGKRLFKANPAGTADILGSVVVAASRRGQPVGIECKRHGESQNETQRWWQKVAEAAGWLYFVSFGPQQAMAFVDQVRRQAA